MRRALGPVLAALVTGLLLSSTVATAAADSGSGSAADAIAQSGSVTASRAEVGSCVTLTGGEFAPGHLVDVRDGSTHVRTVRSGANGEIAAGVCFNGDAKPGRHSLVATGPGRSGGSRTVTSDVYVVGGSALARAPHRNSAAGHTRVTSIVAAALLLGVPLLVLVLTVSMLLRATGRLRSRRRLARQAAEASLLIDSASAAPVRPASRARSVAVPLLAGVAVAGLLCVVYGAARASHLVRQVHVASDDLAAAVRHLQVGETTEANSRAQRAVDAASSARSDETDPVVRLLSRLPGLRTIADSLRVERSVAESAAVSVGAAPTDQRSAASSDLSRLGRISDTGWSAVDDRADDLRRSLRVLGAQADARVAAEDLRAPMLSAGRRYLLLLQDDRTARATGGIVTAHALLTARAHALTLDSVTPAGGAWQLVNLSPDFPTVAQTALGLWQQEHGAKVDGVIAIDNVALSRLGAAPGSDPADQLRSAFDALRAATRTPVGFNATIVAAGSGGHVQLWSAHPTEEQQLRTLSVGGALSGRPANSFELVTQSVAGSGGTADELRRDVSYAWRPTLRKDDIGAGPQLMNEAGVDVRLTNTSGAAQPTWVLLYLPRGSGFVHAALDGTAVSLHTGEEQGMTVLSTVVVVPGGGSTLLSLQLLTPTPDGGPPVYVGQPRMVPDDVAVTRV